MLEKWAVALIIMALIVVVLNIGMMALFLQAIYEEDRRAARLFFLEKNMTDVSGHSETHTETIVRVPLMPPGRLDDLEDAVAKLKGQLATQAEDIVGIEVLVGKLKMTVLALGGIEARIRDMVRKRWKAAGVKKPKKAAKK